MRILPMSNNHHFICLYHFLHKSFYRLDIMSSATFIGTFQKILKSKQIIILFLLQFKLLSCTTVEEFMLISKGFKLINKWNIISQNLANFVWEKTPTFVPHVLEQDLTTIFILSRRCITLRKPAVCFGTIRFYQDCSIYLKNNPICFSNILILLSSHPPTKDALSVAINKIQAQSLISLNYVKKLGKKSESLKFGKCAGQFPICKAQPFWM